MSDASVNEREKKSNRPLGKESVDKIGRQNTFEEQIIRELLFLKVLELPTNDKSIF